MLRRTGACSCAHLYYERRPQQMYTASDTIAPFSRKDYLSDLGGGYARGTISLTTSLALIGREMSLYLYVRSIVT